MSVAFKCACAAISQRDPHLCCDSAAMSGKQQNIFKIH
uniref:Uncharacterized protein n=1 Tax=Siphoviridae sp. ct0UO21 TaxID=2825293 RepID=A0A8S5PCZ3_9CAUD|nr:MAG TPA: hypothetical protein [Siphoviridae sp. ct0UO21]